MRKVVFFSVCVLITVCCSLYSYAQPESVMVGGSRMTAENNIMRNLSGSVEHTKLMLLIKASGFVGSLADKGPYTVLAPVNAAFLKLPKDTVNKLLYPKDGAQSILLMSQHLLKGIVTTDTLIKKIKEGNGKAVMKTQAGRQITFTQSGNAIFVQDAKGNRAKLTIVDAPQKNGVIHVIDGLLRP